MGLESLYQWIQRIICGLWDKKNTFCARPILFWHKCVHGNLRLLLSDQVVHDSNFNPIPPLLVFRSAAGIMSCSSSLLLRGALSGALGKIGRDLARYQYAYVNSLDRGYFGGAIPPNRKLDPCEKSSTQMLGIFRKGVRHFEAAWPAQEILRLWCTSISYISITSQRRFRLQTFRKG